MNDCTAPADIGAWTACNVDAVVGPVMTAVELIVGVSVSLAVLMVGVMFVRRVVREFGR